MTRAGLGISLSFHNARYEAICRAVKEDAKNPPTGNSTPKSTDIKRHINHLIDSYLEQNDYYDEEDKLPDGVDLGEMSNEQKEYLREALKSEQ